MICNGLSEHASPRQAAALRGWASLLLLGQPTNAVDSGMSVHRRKGDVHVSVLHSRLGGAKLAEIGHVRLVRSGLRVCDAAERDVNMLISQKDGRMSRILTIGVAQLRPIHGRGREYRPRMLDLIHQSRQRVNLRD
jgi:hypothetical protein